MSKTKWYTKSISLLVVVFVAAIMILTMVAPAFAKPPEPGGGSASHSASTTHEFEVGEDGGPDGWNNFQSADGLDHLYGGTSTYIAIQFGGTGGTIDDGDDGDFTTVVPVALTDPSATGFREHTYCEYTGTGYKVTQYTYSNDTADGDDWAVVGLAIENTGPAALTSGYVMLHLDWDVGESLGNLSGWDSARNMIYQYEDDGTNYCATGAMLLCQPLHGYGTGPYAGNEGDTWRDGEFTTPSNNVEATIPDDYVTWIMAELPTIMPGNTEVVAFVMSTGYSTADAATALSNLQNSMDDAVAAYSCPAAPIPPSPPGVPTMNHWGIAAMITLFAGLLAWVVRRRRLAS